MQLTIKASRGSICLYGRIKTAGRVNNTLANLRHSQPIQHIHGIDCSKLFERYEHLLV
jgi:hypothetical protein